MTPIEMIFRQQMNFQKQQAQQLLQLQKQQAEQPEADAWFFEEKFLNFVIFKAKTDNWLSQNQNKKLC